MSDDKVRAPEQTKSNVDVWDTQYLPPSKAFGAFRDGLCSAFMPWSIDTKPERDFEGRIESVTLERGSIGRVRMSPVVAARTKSNLAGSSADCVYGNFILSGELNIEQRGLSNVAKQGDVILYDSSAPTTLRERHDLHYEDVPFMIPKTAFSAVKDVEMVFGNVVLPRDALIRPLSSCLTFLAENMLSLSKAELTALFDACVTLLPMAVGYPDSRDGEKGEITESNYILREILDYVNRQISSADLSPQTAADSLGISVRYVHKLFAAKGTTFGSYVASKRLEHIRKDLISPSCRNQPISILAYRWGFNDLSTFNRSFKQRYGVTPSQFRAASGN